MSFDEALEVLRCSRTADWVAVQRQYDEQYNELQRLQETATTREERQEYVGKLQAVEAAYAFLKALPGFGPVAAPELTLPLELQQALLSPFADRRVDAVRTLRHLLQAYADLASLARQTLVSMVQGGSAKVAQEALEAAWATLQELRQAAEQAAPREWFPREWLWSNTIGMQFVRIPAGTFQMGCTDGDADDIDDDDIRYDEIPAHQVTLSRAFYLGQYKVTQGQWQAVMGVESTLRFLGRNRDQNFPVDHVSWDEVQAFIDKLNTKESGRGYTYRLPSEAQWEYAVRAGSTTAYSFGDDAGRLGDYAWYKVNAGEERHPVGQKCPNAWGLYDMHGSACEWVQDWFGAYTTAAVVDPQGPSSGLGRVVRGGRYSFDDDMCRSSHRFSVLPDGGSGGFRLLRTVP